MGLLTNSIRPAGGLPSGAKGGIIQIKQNIKSDTSSFQANTGSFSGNISGLTETITTQTNSSKVLIVLCTHYSTATNQRGSFRILRGSTVIGVGDSSGSAMRCLSPSLSPASSARAIPLTMMLIDTPGNAGTYTYNVQGNAESAAGTVWINRNASSSYQQSTHHVGISTITLMELGE